MRLVWGVLAVAAGLAAVQPAAAGWQGSAAAARSGLDRAVASGRLPEIEAQEYRRDVAAAARVIRASRAGAGSPVAAALADVAAHHGGYDRPRALALFHTLRLNTRLWNDGGLPPVGRTTADADGVAYRAVARGGVRFHPLASFGNLNREAELRNYRSTIRLAYALLARARARDGELVWEYNFHAAGGSAPWTSGLAQAVAAQALARAGFKAEARRAYRPIPRRLLLRLPEGPWIRLYSFSGTAVLNAQLQAAVSLEEYGRLARDPGARKLARELRTAAARLMPRFDTGSWSLYALRGDESTLAYHQYVTSLLWKLSDRTGERRWARWAARFRHQWRTPPKLERRTPAPPALPVPADGFRDLSEIRLRLSKPATVTASIAGETVVRRLGAGDQSLWWDPGKRAPGSYAVRVRAVDRVGNASERRLPPVRIERDREPPRLEAQLRDRTVSWRARDGGTPWLRVRILLRRGGGAVEQRLDQAPLAGRHGLGLEAGDRRFVTLAVADSSGNETRLDLGQLAGTDPRQAS